MSHFVFSEIVYFFFFFLKADVQCSRKVRRRRDCGDEIFFLNCHTDVRFTVSTSLGLHTN